jgi:hypothetical protein
MKYAVVTLLILMFSITSLADNNIGWPTRPCPRPKPAPVEVKETLNLDKDEALLFGAVVSSIIYGGLKENRVKSKHAYAAAVLGAYAFAGLSEKSHENRTKAGQSALPAALLAPLLLFTW